MCYFAVIAVVFCVLGVSWIENVVNICVRCEKLVILHRSVE